MHDLLVRLTWSIDWPLRGLAFFSSNKRPHRLAGKFAYVAASGPDDSRTKLVVSCGSSSTHSYSFFSLSKFVKVRKLDLGKSYPHNRVAKDTNRGKEAKQGGEHLHHGIQGQVGEHQDPVLPRGDLKTPLYRQWGLGIHQAWSPTSPLGSGPSWGTSGACSTTWRP